MKIRVPFRLPHAILPVTLLLCARACAQDGPGGKPEVSAPPAETMHMAPAKPKVRSTTLTITLGDKTFTLTPAELAAMPQETATVTNGHSKATETYIGVPIAAVLEKLGLPFEKANEHTLLKTYLVAEGTDGYRVLVSAYETLAPIRSASAIVALTQDGKPLAADGAFKIIIPGDTRPQRWVQNLKSLTFKTVD
jgi:hypothetical protein